ncbi:unnamed protein product, partial [Ectocarpus sp. 12 AP-2014]
HYPQYAIGPHKHLRKKTKKQEVEGTHTPSQRRPRIKKQSQMVSAPARHATPYKKKCRKKNQVSTQEEKPNALRHRFTTSMHWPLGWNRCRWGGTGCRSPRHTLDIYVSFPTRANHLDT